MKPKAWSYSALNSFLTCQRRYYEINIAKSIPYVQGAEAAWGDQVHKHFEKHIKGEKDIDTTNLPESLKANFKSTLQRLEGYELSAEGKVAMNKGLEICGYFDKDVWVRGVIDLLGVRPEVSSAVILDWKTGKIKPDLKQLKLFALFTFYARPEIATVDTVFEWVAYNDRTEATFTRDQIPELWMEFLPDLKLFKNAFVTEKWPERKSGLCKNYCGVVKCQHNGMYKGI